MKRVLHAGCGGAPLPDYFGECEETRLDVSPENNPDIVANITDMGDIGKFDVIYCSHTLEHLYPHEVIKALREFRRVLKEDGMVVIFVPDLEDITVSDEILYESPSGPVRAIDMIYGGLTLIENRPYMAHHIGFTKSILENVLRSAGFSNAILERHRESFNLMAIAK